MHIILIYIKHSHYQIINDNNIPNNLCIFFNKFKYLRVYKTQLYKLYSKDNVV